MRWPRGGGVEAAFDGERRIEAKAGAVACGNRRLPTAF